MGSPQGEQRWQGFQILLRDTEPFALNTEACSSGYKRISIYVQK